ncbi:protoporphyrinogen/coproporphyrinogen oxidase [Actinomadura algeriensis]|uniref:Oxygen-dependent protoporphyrinogen oxidase n=1 Tax=Actinomadura algeriensis TaxID=1679523 RepID=A0ABR9JQR7_9ACTN|nr:NAD(P)/FAD-dependent oxidoreductase [Actinomadura algeriensis]MBE1532828.1 oxygen-dependent protoporphyrinogen oxidase [Actinomadura algeriensis]
MTDVDVEVAVVGAGPAGLAAAHALAEAGRTVRVLEAADAVGGRMRTVREHGCLIDIGAEMFPDRPAYPATWRLISALGLDADPAAVPRVPDALAVWRGGRTRPHVGRPLGLLTGAGLPVRARLDLVRFQARLARLADLDPQRPEHTSLGTATVADLVRPYHRDLRGYLVDPLVGGFFGWDPERSAAAPFAAHLATSGGSGGWRTYRDGMDALARALAGRLDVVLGHPVTRVTAGPGPVRLESPRGTVTARAAVLAVPAPVAARLHPDAPPAAREFLRGCGYAPMLRASLVLDRPLAPRGARPRFATLVPAAEDPLLGVITADHHKHPGRAPGGRGLLSLITSPRGTAELVGAPDDAVTNRLLARAERFVPALSRHVEHVRVSRFRYGLPEATPRALRLRAAFAGRPVAAVEYAGDWTVLRPCSEGAVASGGTAAARILAHLSGGRGLGDALSRDRSPHPRQEVSR